MRSTVHRLEQMSGPAVDALDRDRTLAIIPFGILEFHGPHLPYGTDLFINEAVTERMIGALSAAEPSLELLLHPTIPLGSFGIENLSPSRFPSIGSFVIPPETLTELVKALAGNFARFGFKRLAIVSFHGAPVHCTAVNRGADEAQAELGIQAIPVLSYLFFPLFFGGKYLDRFQDRMEGRLSAEEREALRRFVHAEAFETSAILHLKPELVDGSYRKLKPVVFDYEEMFEGIRKLPDWQGYVGIPSVSRPEIGRAVIDVVGEECGNLVVRWLRGETLQDCKRYPEGLAVPS